MCLLYLPKGNYLLSALSLSLSLSLPPAPPLPPLCHTSVPNFIQGSGVTLECPLSHFPGGKGQEGTAGHRFQ